MRIVPDATGLMLEGQPREAIGEGRIVEVFLEETVRDDGLPGRPVAEIAVGQAGGVPQQILDGWCRPRPERPTPSCRITESVAKEGMKAAIGWSSRSRPRSIITSAATETIVLVIE